MFKEVLNVVSNASLSRDMVQQHVDQASSAVKDIVSKKTAADVAKESSASPSFLFLGLKTAIVSSLAYV